MNYIEAIHLAVKKKNPCVYLEIGVAGGASFISNPAAFKIGVDPGLGENVKNISASMYEMTSDEYFKTTRNYADIVFIDGLHSYEQSYKDVLNSLEILNPGGIIFIHDCLPGNEREASPEMVPGAWCGDVWKTIIRVQNLYNIDVFTVDIPYGLGVVTRKEITLDYIAIFNMDNITYDSWKKHKNHYMNLKTPEQYEKWLEEYTNEK